MVKGASCMLKNKKLENQSNLAKINKTIHKSIVKSRSMQVSVADLLMNTVIM